HHSCLAFSVSSAPSPPRHVHSFPTRRSSDLQPRGQLRCGGAHQFGKPGCARRGIGVVHAPGGAEEGTEREVGGRRLVEPALGPRSEEHTSELQSRENLVCRLLLEKKKNKTEK